MQKNLFESTRLKPQTEIVNNYVDGSTNTATRMPKRQMTISLISKLKTSKKNVIKDENALNTSQLELDKSNDADVPEIHEKLSGL